MKTKNKNKVLFSFKYKEGFTLIELLAVIIVLSVIALIATPITFNIIDSLSEKTFRVTVSQLFNAYELYETSDEYDPETISMEATDPKLLFKSNLKSGTIHKIDEKTEVKNVTDGVYCAKGFKNTFKVVKGSCSILDDTPAIMKINIGLITSNSIKISVEAEDPETGISGYLYSIDDGKTYTKISTNNVYTFSNLKHNTEYNIKVKVINGNKLEAISATQKIKTITLDTPVYSVDKTGWQQQKIVTITYPNITGQTLGYEYSTDKGVTWIEAAQKQTITFTNNGTVIARVSDKISTVTSSVFTIDQIDRGKPVIVVDPKTVMTSDDVNYNPLSGVTATDLSGIKSITYNSTPTWSATQAGIYTITYTATDNAGNTSTDTRTVDVQASDVHYLSNIKTNYGTITRVDNVVTIKLPFGTKSVNLTVNGKRTNTNLSGSLSSGTGSFSKDIALTDFNSSYSIIAKNIANGKTTNYTVNIEVEKTMYVNKFPHDLVKPTTWTNLNCNGNSYNNLTDNKYITQMAIGNGTCNRMNMQMLYNGKTSWDDGFEFINQGWIGFKTTMPFRVTASYIWGAGAGGDHNNSQTPRNYGVYGSPTGYNTGTLIKSAVGCSSGYYCGSETAISNANAYLYNTMRITSPNHPVAGEIYFRGYFEPSTFGQMVQSTPTITNAIVNF